MGGEGTLPVSPALAEATTDSLAEVMSRDPEGYSRQDRDRIVETLRANRARLAAAEAAGESAPKQKKNAVPLSTKASASPEDLGF